MFGLLAQIALAQGGETLPGDNSVVQPRILVILDTSRSMLEVPDPNAVSPGSSLIVQQGEPGGDFNCGATGNATCRNKLCAAKEVLCQTMTANDPDSSLSSSASVGLATYYQYVINLVKQDRRSTACLYDVIEGPGTQRLFPLQRDLTGTLNNNCNSVTGLCDAGDTADVDLFSATGPFYEVCQSATTLVPGSTQSVYKITKVSATAVAGVNPTDCYLYDWSASKDFPSTVTPRTRLTITPGPVQCTGIVYSAAVVQQPINDLVYRVARNASCSPLTNQDQVATFPTKDIPSTPPSNKFTNPTAATTLCKDTAYNAGTDCFTAGTLGTTFDPTHPLELYLNQSPTLSGSQGAYALFDPKQSFRDGQSVPAPTSSVSGNSFNAATNYTNPAGPATLSWVNSGNGSTCELNSQRFSAAGETKRFTSGTLSAFGFDRAVDAVHDQLPLQSGEIDVTPTIASNPNISAPPTFGCTPQWPCDVTLKGLASANWVSVGTTHAEDPSCTAVSCGPSDLGKCQSGPQASNQSTNYWTLKGTAACATFTSSSSPVTNSETRVDSAGLSVFPSATSWPTDCGLGKDLCTFRPVAAAGDNAAPNCPIYRKFGTGALTPAEGDSACPAYQAAFNTPVLYGNSIPTKLAVSIQDPRANVTCADKITINSGDDLTKYQTQYGPLSTVAAGQSSSFLLENTGAQLSQAWGYTTTSAVSPEPGDSRWAFVGKVFGSSARAGATYTSRQGSGTETLRLDPDPLFAAANFVSNQCATLAGWNATSIPTGTEAVFTKISPSSSYQFAGSKATGASNCGSEGNQPCYSCVFVPILYEWKKDVVTCDYTVDIQEYHPTAVPVCQYRLDQYDKRSCQGSCEYKVDARRYDWNASNYKECRYTAVPVRLSGLVYNYTYSFVTKGGELFGTKAVDVQSPATFCDPNSPVTYDGTSQESQDFRAACPAATNCMAGTNTYCKLRSNDNTVKGRYALERGIQLNFSRKDPSVAYHSFGYGRNTDDPRNLPQIECLSGYQNDWNNGYSDATTRSNAEIQSAKANFCSPPQTGRQEHWALTSDWYEPTASASANDIKAAFLDFPANQVAWSKNSDPSVKVPRAAAFSGYLQPPGSQVFVPIPDDATNASSRNVLLKNALRKCKPISGIPMADGGDVAVDGGYAYWDHSQSGACLSDEADRASPVPAGQVWSRNLDFTPLYGSLANARDYMAGLVDSDPDYLCRKYYVILATDGDQNQPYTAPYSDTDLVEVVRSYQTIVTRGQRNAKVGAFIVGFGTSVAKGGVLDQMQAVGGVGLSTAFHATDQNELRDALTTIFNSVTAGSYSRSKPTIALGGSRLYTSSYTRRSGSLEWTGEVRAYAVDSSGGTAERWQLSLKLDGVQQDGDRNITTAVTNAGASQQPFTYDPSATELNTLLSVGATFADGGSVGPDQIVHFIRNPTNNAPYPFAKAGTVRKSRLGPIVRSSPVVIGGSPFDTSYAGATGGDAGATTNEQQAFADYAYWTRSREPRVLVGTSDGMLRGLRDLSDGGTCAPSNGAGDFLGGDGGAGGSGPDGVVDDGDSRCANGTEAWSFIPPELLPTLGQQLAPTGVPIGVDGTTVATDICWKGNEASGCKAGEWQTVAYGTLRGGGKAIFALDVTQPSKPSYLWQFTDQLLGYTYSAPAIGRVRANGHDVFAAIFGGGRTPPNAARPTVQTAGGRTVQAVQGQSLYVLNAATGEPLAGDSISANNLSGPSQYVPFVELATGTTGGTAIASNIVVRPAIFRQTNNQYTSAVYVPVDRKLAVMRLTDQNGVPIQIPDQWKPRSFWAADVAQKNQDGGTTAPITQVMIADAGTATAIPQYGLGTPSVVASQDQNAVTDFANLGADSFPVSKSAATKPILTRPLVAAVVNGDGKSADIFFGTGDTEALDASNANYKYNYIVALHDPGTNASTGASATYLWGHYFLDAREQVVSEPTITTGCLIVATYIPPATTVIGGARCGEVGVTRIYGFDPLTGALNDQCLSYQGGVAGWRSQKTSVLDLGAVGIPSEIVLTNGMGYLNTGNKGLLGFGVNSTGKGFGVRSFRRIR